MRKFRYGVEKVKRLVQGDIWTLDMDSLSKTKIRLIRDLRVLLVALDNFKKQKTGFQSIALCYFCAMATVPIIAVCFALTDGFGISDLLRNVLYSNFSDYPELTSTVLGWAENILNAAKSGPLGLLSALMFVWLIIWMMMRVETVFNDVWHVKKSRNFFRKLGIDIAIICLTPFVLLIFFFGSIVYSKLFGYIYPNSAAFSESIRSFLGWIIFGVIIIFIFSAMYKFIPAAKVRYGFALKGAVISGIAFTVLQYLYLETQVLVTRINMVYGTFAAIPLFMLWLRFGWLIILYGAQFSYSFQKVDNANVEQL